MPGPLLVINAVGLTSRWLTHAPALNALAQRGWCVPLRDVSPAVTCTAQATLLTGELPNRHGIVANGWLFRDTNEVRFWQQSNAILDAEPLYATARRRAAERGVAFKSAKLFWWFNQGAAVDLSVTPKPHYGIDGSKHFDIATSPPELGDRLKQSLGPFPFASFWGPMSGEQSTQWIAAAAALTLLEDRPDLTLAYLPHLDYEPQRRGPAGCEMARCVGELDRACEPLLDAARAVGARVWVISEYGHVDVTAPVYINRALRQAGLLEVRRGPFGEQIDLFASRAFAVCDHQLAHVYVRQSEDRPRVVDLLRGLRGVDSVFAGDERAGLALDHSRSGEVIALSRRDSWFAYPFWLNDRDAPDYARCVAIHHKPGFDPCELFFDPAKWFPKLRVAGKLAKKAFGFRMKMDVIPLDATIVRGSHGLAASDDADLPIWIGDGDRPGAGPLPMTAFRPAALEALGLGE
ncbi:MAG: alkaline phosphatase family protein [Gemmataceae bacterium]|nr:alkaline phosphatase family protein [Gemmataceae bacterium]